MSEKDWKHFSSKSPLWGLSSARVYTSTVKVLEIPAIKHLKILNIQVKFLRDTFGRLQSLEELKTCDCDNVCRGSPDKVIGLLHALQCLRKL